MQEIQLEGYETLYIKPLTYKDNNRYAIQLDTLEEGPFAILTHNMAEVELMEREILVKTYSENEILKPLVNTKYFKDTKKRIYSGYVVLEIWTIEDEELLESLKTKQIERLEEENTSQSV